MNSATCNPLIKSELYREDSHSAINELQRFAKMKYKTLIPPIITASPLSLKNESQN